jgi:hypothetical protein
MYAGIHVEAVSNTVAMGFDRHWTVLLFCASSYRWRLLCRTSRSKYSAAEPKINIPYQALAKNPGQLL